jgi:hypothetical protein
VTVDARKVTKSTRIGVTWRNGSGVQNRAFTVAPDTLVRKGTWQAKRGTVIKVLNRNTNKLLASTRR